MKATLFLRAQKYFVCSLYILSYSDKNKYGNGNNDLLNDSAFRANRRSEINTTLRGINEFLFVLPTITPFFSIFVKIGVRGLHRKLLIICEILENRRNDCRTFCGPK